MANTLTKNITQRDAFWNQIYEEAKTNRNIVIITADMGAPALDKFRIDFGTQFINVGIAEQNGMLIASGLALTGKRVFVYAIAPFITIRCLEQTRVNSGIMKIPITIVGVSGGFGYVDAGPTHHSTEDIAIMRAIPHMRVDSVSDSVMAQAVARRSCHDVIYSNYVRLDRQPNDFLYNENSDFSNGFTVLREGNFYIVATGHMTHVALQVSDELNKRGLDVGVIDLYEIPIHVDPFLEAIRKSDGLITLEEHYHPGGLGSCVCEVLMDHRVYKPIERIALPREKGYCYEYGARESIQKYFEVDKDSVIQRVGGFVESLSTKESVLLNEIEKGQRCQNQRILS